MRTQFCSSEEYKSAKEVKIDNSWAEWVVEVDGGWLAFESRNDLDTWENQV